MSPRPDVSVVLGTYNRMRFLELAVETVRRELDGVPHEIIVVDGGSTDGTARWLVGQKDIVTIVQHNRGTWRGKPVARRPWAYFMNLGFRCAGGTYVCMISDDCLVVPGAIRKGCRLFGETLASGRKVGAVAFYWRNWPEQKRYWVGRTLGNRMFVNHGLYLRHAVEEAGYFDEETFRFYHADGDLCLAMWRLGYECIDSPESFVEHYSHADPRQRSANNARQEEDWARYLGKWEGIFYSPEKDDIGGWIEKEHHDPHGTAEMFRRAGGGRPGPVEAVRAGWRRIRGSQ
jgi:GT2 family glycosyltransferase